MAQAEQQQTTSTPPATGYVTARVMMWRTFPAYDQPGGNIVARVRPHTDAGSTRVFGVIEQRGDWLAVTLIERPGRVTWVKNVDGRFGLDRTTYSVHVDLSARRLQLWSGQRVVMSVRVGVGAVLTPTPTGRSSVIDKLTPSFVGSRTYGGGVLSISTVQPHPPAWWPKGLRPAMAIHGTPDGSGRGASAGCVRVDDRNLRRLMLRVPLGAPVFIER